MFPYRVKYADSESDIKKKKRFVIFSKNANVRKVKIKKIEKCNMYNLYNSVFVFFGFVVNFVLWGFLYFCIYIHYTCRSLNGDDASHSCHSHAPRFVPRRNVAHILARQYAGGQLNESLRQTRFRFREACCRLRNDCTLVEEMEPVKINKSMN